MTTHCDYRLIRSFSSRCSSLPNDVAPEGQCDVVQSTAAALEWFIAFLFDAYIISFIWDLWPATKTRGRKFVPELIEKDRRNELHRHADGRPGAPITEADPVHADLRAPQPAHLAGSETSSGYSHSDIGPRVGRPSEDLQMRQHNMV